MQTNGGKRIVVGTDWTDSHPEKVNDALLPAHLLDYNGLRQVLALIEHIHPGESQPEEGDYDGIMRDEIHPSQVEPSSEAQNDPNSPQQRTGNPEPSLGGVEPRAADRGDPADGTVGVQAGGGPNQKPLRGGP